MPIPLPAVRPGRYLTIQLGSALLPGALILLETWLIVTAPRPILETANESVAGVSNWVLSVAAIAVLIVAYAIGIIGRTSSFRYFWFRSPRDTAEHRLLADIDDVYGEADVRRALAHHPALEQALGEAQRNRILAYTKLWLRERRPVLAVDHFEFELNFLVGLSLPLLMLPFAALRLSHWPWDSRPWWASTLTGVGAAVLGSALVEFGVRRAKEIQHYEAADALRNLLFAEWFGDIAAPVSPADSADRPGASTHKDSA